ncbi:AAA domain-containing protein [Kineosporia sp. NBRC 101731]|uniref:AAA domain-containing protein n=1 Tax=Kineosporia sp. NBRC 101731 TaxID=3032199 RepID=UPI0024A06FBE|nr:AAA domain-containing protein [Kineosporia sp. NBRC 101731]GLY33470.1 very short patch repair endonuclease [Kineosporia sp. NBRC 101731]
MSGISAQEARVQTRKLIDFLVEITESAERNPELDILQADRQEWRLWWLEDMPPGGPNVDLACVSGTLLRMLPPARPLAPPPPAAVATWLDPTVDREVPAQEPRLLEQASTQVAQLGTDSGSQASPTSIPGSVVRQFERWLVSWQEWAQHRRQAEQLQPLYDYLADVCAQIEQRDNDYELVLCRGLVRWQAPDGTVVRRHLVTEQLLPTVNSKSAEVVLDSANGSRRYEDSQVFGTFESYQHDRGSQARQTVEQGFQDTLPGPQIIRHLGDWVGQCLLTGVRAATTGAERIEPGTTVEVSDSPALILRPRSKAALAEAYKKISRQLRDDECPVPVAMSQLITDTDAHQRQEWVLAQGGTSGDVLGQDPRFPLAANEQQEQVMDLLRRETGVVVQGPPGTGKTHTIANLVSALLARGQRVLVTSEKDQALRVLRDKIPQELRHLCVLLAGGGRSAAEELEQGLDALCAAIATNDAASLEQRAQALAAERLAARQAAADLNERIGRLRESEHHRHPPVISWYSSTSYAGTLSDIVREVRQHESQYNWLPPLSEAATTAESFSRSAVRPPLPTEDMLHLHQLLLTDSPQRHQRLSQHLPPASQIPDPGPLAQWIDTETRSREMAHRSQTDHSRQLTALSESDLTRVNTLSRDISHTLQQLGYAHDDGVTTSNETRGSTDASAVLEPGTAPSWACTAVDELLAGRGKGLWGTLLGVREEAPRLQEQLRQHGVDYVVDVAPIAANELGVARGALDTGREFAAYVRGGGKFRSAKWLQSRQQSQASDFLSMVKVNGKTPTTQEFLDAAVQRMEAEVAALQLTEKWADCGVDIPCTPSAQRLSDLVDKSDQLNLIHTITQLHGRLTTLLEPVGLSAMVRSVTGMTQVSAAATAAQQHLQHQQLKNRIDALTSSLRRTDPTVTCPEVADLLTAVRERDMPTYIDALARLEQARAEQSAAVHLADLKARLQRSHPSALSLIEETASHPAWPGRLKHIRDAWAWRQAEAFILSQRTAQEERDLQDEYLIVEEHIQNLTAQLAATEAMSHTLARMSDEHARALRTYQEHMIHSSGDGQRVRTFQRAARAAMDKAKTAVPAWVVPLPKLLANLPVERNSFDVVIVDEASQAGMEQLYLLWLAPRVIVVGDNKQCTPSDTRLGGHKRIFQQLPRFLDGVDSDIQNLFTPKTNLYGLLSARSGKDNVVRLREHFRCVPEIINWSSKQFYELNGTPGLIPLRERRAGDLPPLIVHKVEDAVLEGRRTAVHNTVEARHIAEQLRACIDDTAYHGKTFGIVVLLASRGHMNCIDRELRKILSSEEMQQRKVRVGQASDFQGDERDVIFLSMVVTGQPQAQRALMYRQSINVAATRAREQLRLFTSVELGDLKPGDLRGNLMSYMMDPPSVYGPSPTLDAVSATRPTTPFESLLEQRVFREIKTRGFHVVPQYKVGTRTLDLVVTGDGARVGVECDGYRFHTSTTQIASDARRDRELARMHWDIIRVRESEFEFDREHEMAPVWKALEARGIQPTVNDPEVATRTWAPIELPDEDEDDDE